MFEKKLYQEIPGGKSKFHSAILTSFSFNFHHFEYQVLRTLRQKWISSVIVFADQNMLDNDLGIASGNLKQLSQSYSVIGIESQGAFHPKINLLIGDEQLLVFFGSGNITPGGHGKNHELFTGFLVDKNDKKQLPLILEVWNYITRIADNIEGYARERLLKVLPGTCSMLNEPLINKHIFHMLEDSTEVAFLYNDETTIFQQLNDLIPNEDITKITVVSPYFDEDGKTLLNLKEHFANASIDVFLPLDFGLPPVKLSSTKSITFYSWEETERGKKTISSTEDYKRKLHSKIFHFESNENEYCLIGSANATVAGLGSISEESSNQEFCALYKTKKQGLLESLGISGTYKKISLTGLMRATSIKSEKGDMNVRKTVRITSTDLSGSRLKVFYKVAGSDASFILSIYNGNGIRIFNKTVDLSESRSISIQLSAEILKHNPGYVLFENKNGNTVSNKQIINYIDKLLNTDPSKGNRNIRQIINAFEGGTINEFEIIEYINNLNRNTSDSANPRKINIGTRKKNEEPSEVYDSEMTYEEAVIASKNSSKSESIFKGHSSTRLWETISRLFQEKKNTVSEELMDEEEEGNAEKSRERNEADIEKTSIIVNNSDHFNKMFASAKKLSENYTQSLKKIRYMTDYKINELDLGNFLLVTHILTVVCNFREYKFENLKDESKCQSKLETFYITSMLNILVNFSKLIMKKVLENYTDNEYQKSKFDDYLQKTIYHFWMYVYLIQRKSPEPVVINKAELVGLNFLHFLGKPDQTFELYMKNLSATYSDMYFNPVAVVRFYNKILDSYSNQNDQFIGIDHSGICKVLSCDSKYIEYNSLFAHGRISHAKLKKHRIMIDCDKTLKGF